MGGPVGTNPVSQVVLVGVGDDERNTLGLKLGVFLGESLGRCGHGCLVGTDAVG